MYKIDAHNHPDFCGMNYEKVIENMDKFGIDKICLLSWENPMDENGHGTQKTTPSPLGGEVPVPFERCLNYYEKAPDRFILGYAPDPRRTDALGKMESAIKTYGVKICGEVKFRMMYDNPDAIDLFNLCGEYGLPVILHIDNPDAHLAKPGEHRKHWWYGGDVDTLERLLKACPNTKFLGHAPGFWSHISKDDQWKTISYPKGPVIPGGRIEELLEKYDNLYCECSAGSALNALRRDTEYTKNLILKHPDKFIYGRDYYDNSHSEFFDSLGLPEENLKKIYSKNLLKILPQ